MQACSSHQGARVSSSTPVPAFKRLWRRDSSQLERDSSWLGSGTTQVRVEGVSEGVAEGVADGVVKSAVEVEEAEIVE